VIELARGLMERGKRVGILTRGHGGTTGNRFHLVEPEDPASLIGDEAREMFEALPGVRIAVDRDRLRAAQELKRLGVEVLVLDDGFQNLSFTPGVTVLLVSDLERNRIPYRDFDSEARFADFRFQLKGRPTARFPGVERLRFVSEALPEKPLWILCGVGDPEEVRHFYERAGARVDRLFALADHATIDPERVKRLRVEASAAGAVLAVTAKDRVKLPTEGFDDLLILRRRIQDPSVFGPVWDRLQ
jgi:tetraacyldisaccharide 4'-kinase